MKKYLIILLAIAALLAACSNEPNWHDSKDTIPPGTVTGVQVKNTMGGAEITYTKPADKDLLGVKAVYSFTDGGEQREMFSSAYTDTIRLEGFPDTTERTIQLISVDLSYNESPAVQVAIKPDIPPVGFIANTLKIQHTFGGVNLAFENETKMDLAVILSVSDDTGTLTEHDTYYTNRPTVNHSFRGLDNTERTFSIRIRDKYDNYSRPVDTTLTPLFEEQILGTINEQHIWEYYGYEEGTYMYRGDIKQRSSGWPFDNIHDGITIGQGPEAAWHPVDDGNQPNHYWPGLYDDDTDMEYPIYFTIDLNRVVALSRHKYWMRSRNSETSKGYREWMQGNLKNYEVWGCKEIKDINEIGDGSKEANLIYWTDWDRIPETHSSGVSKSDWKKDWVKLFEREIEGPPSGTAPPGNADDWAYALEGFETEVPAELSTEEVRYIRVVVNETWQGSPQYLMIVEFALWGAYVD